MPALGLSAMLVGAAGLGAESLLVSSLGPCVGFARAAPLGLAAWICGWALGARHAGRRVGREGHRLLLSGSALAALIPLAELALVRTGGADLPLALALAVGCGAVLVTGIASGTFLPLLTRLAGERGFGGRAVAWLFALNLLGSVLGARLIGFDAPASMGRLLAASLAGAVALAAGIAGWSARRAEGEAELDDAGARASGARGGPDPTPELAPARAGVVLAIATAWIAGIEWIGMRLAVLWLGGMQPALTAVLAATLLALAIGAATLGELVPRDARGPARMLVLASAATLWPFLGVRLVSGQEPDLLQALLLVGPALAPLGAVVPVLHRALPGESGRRLGDLLAFEALGAALGLPLLHAIALPRLGIGGTLGLLAALGGASALLLAPAGGRAAPLAALVGVAGAVLASILPPPALASPALGNPAFRLLSFAEDECFAVSVVEDGVRAERTLLTDDFRATATGDDYLYMRALGHLPLLLHPDPRHVAVLALGTGTTAGAVARHPEVERIEVLEISRRVCAAAALFSDVNGGVLEQAVPGGRVRLRLGDGRWTLRSMGDLDVLTMEPLLPDAPFGVGLYTREFYAIARAALAADGLLCQWVPPHALAPESFDAVVDAFARAFPWSGMFLFGTQLVLIGAQSEPRLSPERFPRQDSQLARSLAELGLDTPAGLVGRMLSHGDARASAPDDAWPRVERALTDADPWILYRGRAAGAEPIAFLAWNLARLRRAERPAPASWLERLDDEGRERARALVALRRARESFARADAARYGLRLPAGEAVPDLASAREQVARLLAGEPEARAFERAARLDESRLGGVLALASGLDREALALLLDAVELSPRRADLHLFVALALERSGETEAARAAYRRALSACPRVLETPQGRRALDLGLDPARMVAGSKH